MPETGRKEGYGMKRHVKEFFSKQLLDWNERENDRQMPWKGEPDPYKIWISEIILQQTRVEQGWDYYLRFIKTYPDVSSLAAAADADVFKLWEGLGYYSRCRNLLAAARQIRDQHNGEFPKNHEAILALKGVGPYTAAAIASFAFQQPYAVVDGNVVRVLARFFGIATPFDSTEGKKQFAELAQKLIDILAPANYNQAIMDFGATVCKPLAPVCSTCVLHQKCAAFKNGTVEALPVRSKKLKKTTRWFNYWFVTYQDSVLLRQRAAKDIWQQLFEFYLLEDKEALGWNDAEIENYCEKHFGASLQSLQRSQAFKQQLTHQLIHARFYRVELSSRPSAPEGLKWVKLAELKTFAFPKIINDWLENGLVQAPVLF